MQPKKIGFVHISTKTFPRFLNWIISGQRCLETGITEVELLLEKEALEKDKMKIFIQSIKETGLSLQEPSQFQPNNPFYKVHTMRYQTRIKPWEIVDE